MVTMTGKKKNEILPALTTVAEAEPEKRMVTSMLSIAVREATRPSTTPKVAKAKKDAIRWIMDEEGGNTFSFGNTVDYVFDDVDHGRIRSRLSDIIDTGVMLDVDDDFDL